MQTKGMVERVKQEVAIHSKLKHPSILELYTFFEDANHVYLVLELAQKGELYKFQLKECPRVCTFIFLRIFHVNDIFLRFIHFIQNNRRCSPKRKWRVF